MLMRGGDGACMGRGVRGFGASVGEKGERVKRRREREGELEEGVVIAVWAGVDGFGWCWMRFVLGVGRRGA